MSQTKIATFFRIYFDLSQSHSLYFFLCLPSLFKMFYCPLYLLSFELRLANF